MRHVLIFLQSATAIAPTLIDSVPWIALNSIRETTGIHLCDKLRPRSESTTEFPHVDFSLITDEVDRYYELFPDSREPQDIVAARCKEFLNWIGTRKEKEILMISHSSFLRTMFTCVIPANDESWKNFDNAEFRTYVVSIPN